MKHFDVFFDLESRQEHSRRIYGVVTGIVTNNEDPEELMRVRVQFPWFSEEDDSYWARICSPVSLAKQANKRLLDVLPEVGAEVLVAFDQGDLRFPYILGIILPLTGRE